MLNLAPHRYAYTRLARLLRIGNRTFYWRTALRGCDDVVVRLSLFLLCRRGALKLLVIFSLRDRPRSWGPSQTPGALTS